jgi:hypothetical protein
MTTIKLKILGREWKRSGDTIEDALSKFDLEWQNIKGKGVMNITQGKKKLEKIYPMHKHGTGCTAQVPTSYV